MQKDKDFTNNLDEIKEIEVVKQKSFEMPPIQSWFENFTKIEISTLFVVEKNIFKELKK